MDIYEKCPILENDNYIVRLLEENDVDDLFTVYSEYSCSLSSLLLTAICRILGVYKQVVFCCWLFVVFIFVLPFVREVLCCGM